MGIPKVLEVINIILAFQLVFFAIVLLFHKPAQLHKKILAVFLLSKGMVYINTILVYSFHIHTIVDYPFLRGLAYSFMFVLHPLIYQYTRSLLDVQLRFKPVYLLHFIPFIVIIFRASILSFLQQFGVTGLHVSYFLVVFFLLQAVVYISASIVLTTRHAGSDEDTVQESLKISWLRTLLYSLLILWSVYSISSIYGLISQINSMGMIVFIELMFFFILLGLIYVALCHGRLFYITYTRKKYYYSRLSDQQKSCFIQLLDNYMADEKVYLDPELTLGKLAGSLNISPRDMSMILNEIKKLNFKEYVNSFRIGKSLELLTDSKNEKKSVQEILFESGFNSASVFYNLFLKHTGTTPKQFRRLP